MNILEFLKNSKNNKNEILKYLQTNELISIFLSYDAKFLNSFIQIDNEYYDGDLIYNLLDNKFLNILKEKPLNFLIYFFRIIFTNSKRISEKFQNEYFCDFVILNCNNFYPKLDEKSFRLLFNRYIVLKADISKLFYYMNITPKMLNNLKLPDDQLLNIFFNANKETKEYILKNYIILINYNIKIIEKFAISNVTLPSYILNNKDFINLIVTLEDSNFCLHILNNLKLNNNIDYIILLRKKYLERKINNNDNYLLEKFKINPINACHDLMKILSTKKIDINVNDNNFLSLYKNYIDFNLENYIIEYHFDDHFKNVIYDLTELISYNLYVKSTISNENLKLYLKIFNIHNLDKIKKIELFNILKEINIQERFYDDIRNTKNIVNQDITNKSLNTESIKQYKDLQLSQKYGVDVYYFNGQDFCGIVKNGINHTSDFPIGHSFSLIGNYNINTYEAHDETFIYEGIKKEQIVHIFPTDSFSLYKPFESKDNIATDMVNVLMSPNQLMSSGNTYNEIVILEKGKNKTDFDKYIPKLKKVALYCIDYIDNKSVEIAKKNNVGIMLINSSKYKNKKLNDEYLTYRSLIKTAFVNQYSYYKYSQYEECIFEKQRIKGL